MLTPDQRGLWLSIRQAILIVLAAIEKYLELPRSVPPKRDRE